MVVTLGTGLSNALMGIHRAQTSVLRAVNDIGRSGPENLPVTFLSLQTARVQLAANVEVARLMDEVQETVLDIRA